MAESGLAPYPLQWGDTLVHPQQLVPTELEGGHPPIHQAVRLSIHRSTLRRLEPLGPAQARAGRPWPSPGERC